MTRAINLLLGTVFLFGCLVPSAVQSQIVYGKPTDGQIQMMMTSWTRTIADDEVSLSQLVVPFSGYLPIRDNLEARIYVATVSNNLDSGPDSYKLSGMTDMRMLVSKSMLDDRFLFNLGLNLPTGKASLDTLSDWQVMNFLSEDFLSLPNRRLGSGFGLNMTAGFASMVGKYKLGSSLTYRHTSAYEAYEGEGDYSPGDQVSLYGGFQRKFEEWYMTGGGTLSTFDMNTLEGRNIYNRGTELGVQFGVGQRRPRSVLSAGISYQFRSKSEIFGSGSLIANELQLYGDELGLRAQYFRSSEDKRWEYGPLVELREINSVDGGLGSANSLGLGAKVSHKLNSQYHLGITMKYYSGSADGGNVDLSGYQMVSSLSGVF